MKKVQFLFVCVSTILVLNLSSCFKNDFGTDNDTTYIKGHLLEYGSETPLPDVTIYLEDYDGELFGGGGTTTVVDSFSTDENGYFDYEFMHSPTGNYLLTYEDLPNYYPIELSSINHGNNDLLKYVDPYAWLKLQLKNVSPVNGQDKLTIAGPWGGGSNWDEFFGIEVDTVVSRRVKGNRERGISWLITKNNEMTKLRDTIYAMAHDTIHYEILY